MEKIIKQYEDYYLIKCYNREEYRSDFNKGILYFKELSFFWKVENEFQQDKEGVIFSQRPDCSSFLYDINSIQSRCVSELMKTGNIIDGIEIVKSKGKQIAEIENLCLNITGYLSCFYLIPKECLKISNKKIDISPINEYNNFFYFLNEYAKEQGYTYVSIYNASQLIEKTCYALNDKNYDFTFGCITYEDVDELTKIKWFSEKQMQKIVFTKPFNFKYQKEFRFFVSPQNKTTDDSISIISDSLESTVISSLVYLTPECYKKLKER